MTEPGSRLRLLERERRFRWMSLSEEQQFKRDEADFRAVVAGFVKLNAHTALGPNLESIRRWPSVWPIVG